MKALESGSRVMPRCRLLLCAALLCGFVLSRTFAQGQFSAATQAQLDSLIAEKSARSAAERKMNSHLVYFAKQSRNQAITSSVTTMRTVVRPAADGRVLVDIKGSVTEALLQFIADSG